MWSAISRSLQRFAPARLPHTRRRAKLERLEERAMLSTIALTVNTLADDPSGPTPGNTTLRDAITQADADTSNSYVITFAVKGTIDLTSALPDLDNSFTIKGPGASKLTIENERFIIDKGNTINLSNMTITKGGIYSKGNLTVSGIDFIQNSQGAIWNGDGLGMGSTLTVTDCDFFDNGDDGPTIYSAAQTLTVTRSIFLNNDGGGILSAGYNTNTLTGDVFIGNSPRAVDAYGAWTINDCVFADNSAAGAGGAIYISFGVMTVYNSIFINNTATGASGLDGLGGGIYSGPGGTLTVSNSTFIGNSAAYYGAIGTQDSGETYNGSICTLTVSDNIFIDNSASVAGGAVGTGYGNLEYDGYQDPSYQIAADVSISNNIFIGNSAVSGGAIYNGYMTGTLVTTNDFFLNNTGGDIYP